MYLKILAEKFEYQFSSNDLFRLNYHLFGAHGIVRILKESCFENFGKISYSFLKGVHIW